MLAASSLAPPMPRAFATSGAPTMSRIPALTEVFDLAKRKGADHVRFNIETKITPDSGDDTPDPETFATAWSQRRFGMRASLSRVSMQSFDWRTLDGAQNGSRPRSSASVSPSRRRRGQYPARPPGPSPWTAGLKSTILRFGAAAGAGRRLRGLVALFSQRHGNAGERSAQTLGFKVIPWTVNEMRRPGIADRDRDRRPDHGLSRSRSRRAAEGRCA